MNRVPCQLALLLIPLALADFALAPEARATCQEGCFTTENTVQGDDALLNNTSGLSNTAIGSNALEHNMGTLFQGSFNTATGAGALTSNTTGNGNIALGNSAGLRPRVVRR